METNVSSHAKKKIVATIGRFMPIHNGHKEFLLKLAKEYDKVVIMIGSCYQAGDARHCISTTERKKMLEAIRKRAKISKKKFVYVPVPDAPTFEKWIADVMEVCKKYKATHFCTGNKEDILDVLASRDEKLDLEFINPEDDSNFPYHATDIRNMIINGEYEKLENLIPDEIRPILFRYTFKEILAASQNRGFSYIEGRQTVDMILLVKNVTNGKVYVLLGKRPKNKKDFPGILALPGGGIRRFEMPIDAAIREFYNETGLKIKMLDDSLEPAIVKFEDVPNSYLEQIHQVGIYGTHDEKLNGTRGGSSECFAIFAEGKLEDYEKYINPHHGLTNVRFYDIETISLDELAYQQNDMLNKAIRMLEAYPDLEQKESRAK